MPFLDDNGVLYLWNKVKALFATKDVVTTTANGLMSSTDKAKLDGVATYFEAGDHITITPVENTTGAKGVKISAVGSTQSYAPATQTQDGLMSSTDKTKLDGLPSSDTLSNTYAKKADITNTYRYRGSVAAAANLPSTGLTAGDVYNIEASSSYGPAGTNVAWTGAAWDALGGLLEITAISNTELDTICV